MTTEEFKRRLTAILSADAEGYSRLMRDDDEATIRTLKTYRTAIQDLVRQYRGRVVDSPGDNLLAEFASILDAVNCAVEMQRELAEQNAELPENRRMRFRIGVNLGDIVEDGEKIYGDGVNIAARMEGLAEGGGVCISGTVYDQIKHKLGLEYEYQGEQEVKNIPEPVRVYKVLSFPGAAAHRVIKAKKAVGKTWRNVVFAMGAFLIVGAAVAVFWHFYFQPPEIKPASVEKMAFRLPDKPSIAVLPFVNMSGDPKQEYFCDGITEEIITALSKTPKMLVIARNSTFTYKGKAAKIKQVAEELGVRYVLEGSVRKEADRVRITAQLIDAVSGLHLWAERYDRNLKDIFTLQDEITKKIITALQVKLTEGEQANIYARGTGNLDAYLKIMEASWLYKQMTKEGILRARTMAEQAIALDPNYAYAYKTLGSTYGTGILLGLSGNKREALKRTIELLRKAIELDDRLAIAHAALGFYLVWARQYDKSMDEGKRALALAPDSADVIMAYAAILSMVGENEEAISFYKEALRLNPKPPTSYLHLYAIALRDSGRYEEAIVQAKKAIEQEPNNLVANVVLTSSLSLAGRDEEARNAAKEILRINPGFSIARYQKRSTQKDRTVVKRFCDALRKAGLPDHPPLSLPDKPSIAVLPFVNMSDDPKQEYFSDGITEEIITALSKTPQLFVIARNSTFTYKRKPTKVQQVGRELGVKYVMEGSVRKSGDKVRVTAQLIDALTGHHLWAERYDRNLKDIFALQNEITMKIITALQVKLTEGDQARLRSKGTKNLKAYLKCLEATGYIRQVSREGNISAKRIAKEGIRLDPEYVRGYALLAYTHLYDVWLGLSKSPRNSFSKAIEMAQKAIELDPFLGEPHRILAHTYVLMRRYDSAIAEAEKSIEMEPGSADPYATLGHVLLLSGRPQEAIAELKKAMRVNPFPPSWYFHNLGAAYSIAGHDEEAIPNYKKALKREPNNLVALVGLTTSYSLSGHLEEARDVAKEVLRLNPKYCIGKGRSKDQAANERRRNAQRKAGLPDCPIR